MLRIGYPIITRGEFFKLLECVAGCTIVYNDETPLYTIDLLATEAIER